MFKNNRAKLAKLFMLVILIGLFFRQWFTHFCDIYMCFYFSLEEEKNFLFATLSSPLKRMQIGAKNKKQPYVQNVQIQSYDVSKIM